MMPASANPRARLAHASFWTMAGTGIHMGAAMIASIAAARILGPVQFGELAIARTTLFTVTLLAGASLGVAASRAVASLRVADPDRAGRVIGLLMNVSLLTAGVATMSCVLFAAPIARQLAAPQLTAALVLSAPYLIFGAVSAVQIGALNGLEAFGSAGRLLAFEGVLSGLLLVGASYFAGVTGAVCGMALAATIAFLARQYVLVETCRRHDVVVRHRGVASELPLIRTLVLPAVLFGLGAQPFAWLARVILARADHGLLEVGVFTAAYAWGSVVLTVASQVTRPAMPILASLHAAGDTADFRRLLRDTLLLAGAAAMLVALPMMLVAPWIMRAYGASFESGARVLIIIAASSVLASLSSALKAALVAAGHVWGQAMQSLFWGVMLIAVFYALRGDGATGLAAAYAVAFAAALIAQVVLTFVAVPVRRPSHPAVVVSVDA